MVFDLLIVRIIVRPANRSYQSKTRATRGRVNGKKNTAYALPAKSHANDETMFRSTEYVKKAKFAPQVTQRYSQHDGVT